MDKQTTEIKKREAQNLETVERARSGKVLTPAVDIVETDNEILVVADMPGVDEKSLDITLEKDILTIRGNVEPKIPDGFKLTYSEYEIGDYQRSFTLTDVVDQDKIAANYKNGILRLRLPKAEPAKPKQIKITTG